MLLYVEFYLNAVAIQQQKEALETDLETIRISIRRIKRRHRLQGVWQNEAQIAGYNEWVAAPMDCNRLAVITLLYRLGLVSIKQENNGTRTTSKGVYIVLNVVFTNKCDRPCVYVDFIGQTVELLKLFL